ncbi:PfkB family carbohydrate kinase [Enterococcus thailandicus]|uniref:PfkB family carbohydrate kinase n=1 Tax=Enterococcus thailandicus TaxID=417368 RepID=UPI0022E82C8D|nr:PfkB family carbohydrate kinase [Enterococcus thailandicus]
MIADFYLDQNNKTQFVMIKEGSKGVFVKSKCESLFFIKAFKVEKIINTVGARNVFSAELISGLTEDKDLQEAVKMVVLFSIKEIMKVVPVKRN